MRIFISPTMQAWAQGSITIIEFRVFPDVNSARGTMRNVLAIMERIDPQVEDCLRDRSQDSVQIKF
jgi:hypothetical protein